MVRSIKFPSNLLSRNAFPENSSFNIKSEIILFIQDLLILIFISCFNFS